MLGPPHGTAFTRMRVSRRTTARARLRACSPLFAPFRLWLALRAGGSHRPTRRPRLSELVPRDTVKRMGPDATYLSEMLDRQLAFLIQQDDHAVVTSIPGFVQALRREPQLAIHLADLHGETEEYGRALQAEEYDGGNPGQLLQLGFDEVGSKVQPGAPLDAYSQKVHAFRGLLGDFNHPFVLPFPGTSHEAVGRVATLLVWLRQLAELVPSGVLRLQTPGYTAMAERNNRIQENARFQTRTDPGVALLSLEAVETLLLESKAVADSWKDGGSLRVQIVGSAVGPVRAAASEHLSTALTDALRPIASEARRAARLLVLDLHRRLYTIRGRLGVVQRFKARCEWHDRERLRLLADDAQAARRSPEHALRDELTLYLFDQGLNPLAETVLGTSSRADVFDPSAGPCFYVEAKQYRDGAGIEKVLQAAFRQALDTVGNLSGTGYSIDEAFIVLFRRNGPRALLPTEPLIVDGLRWHFVLINIAAAQDDASQNKETPLEFSADSLREMLLHVRDEERPDS